MKLAHRTLIVYGKKNNGCAEKTAFGSLKKIEIGTSKGKLKNETLHFMHKATP